ncbi:hypothetical protein A6R68_22782 [Neotoma lepida]|uniref:Clp1 P-loop domain-containing protein n=1 Tax=Neotoma lepida TaxID=56216 RepID=A0A1A6HZ00_NEOLE|nr:hypothetical protein A6R68_22782 [Neotoma lepida]
MVYYGKMSCHNDYENYMEIIKYVFRDYKRESPLIINTMGWVKDDGLLLLITHADVAPAHTLYTVNASWVGLCKILDDMKGYTRGPILLAQNPLCDCLGFGICRGIDMDQRL